jgi:hypothetical protein
MMLKEWIVKYLIAAIPLLLGAYHLSDAVERFAHARYFTASVDMMIVVLDICVFIKIFFDL